jgi:hypothetical protein
MTRQAAFAADLSTFWYTPPELGVLTGFNTSTFKTN